MTPDHNLYLIRTYFKKYFGTLFWDKLKVHSTHTNPTKNYTKRSMDVGN